MSVSACADERIDIFRKILRLILRKSISEKRKKQNDESKFFHIKMERGRLVRAFEILQEKAQKAAT